MRSVTMIVPVGNFTADISRRVRETAFESAQQREVIISMQAIQRCSWSALYQLADLLLAAVTPYRVRLTRALPRTCALLHELGIEKTCFISDCDVKTRECILIE